MESCSLSTSKEECDVSVNSVYFLFLLWVKYDLLTGQDAILSTQNAQNRCLWPGLFSLLLGSQAQQQEKAEHGYDSGAFVYLVECVGCNDPKKVNKINPRSPNQQNINMQF